VKYYYKIILTVKIAVFYLNTFKNVIHLIFSCHYFSVRYLM